MKKTTIRRLLALVAILAFLAGSAVASNAAAPQEELIGYWRFKRGVGGPCAAQIVALEYAFRRNGRYEGNAKMSTGAKYQYTGTYSATDSSCTVYIDGKTVGPFPYHIKNDVLTVEQPEFGCSVQLIRED